MTSNLHDIFRVTTLLQEAESGAIANVFLAKLITKTSVTLTDGETMTDLAKWMDNAFDPLAQWICDTVTFDVVNVFNVTQDRPLGNEPWPVQTAGEQTLDPLPAQCACYVQFETGISRSWGRKFMGGFSELANNLEGYITANLVTALASFALVITNGYTSAASDSYGPYIYSTQINDYRPIVSATVRNVWSTIRRRRIGRGS